MARFICMSCYRNQFNVPARHKKPFNRREICKGPFVRIFKAFDAEQWINRPEPAEIPCPPETIEDLLADGYTEADIKYLRALSRVMDA